MGDECDGETHLDDKNQKLVSILNKPEVPILFVGVIAAAVHGVIFPVFGVLLSSAIKTFYEPPEELKKDSKFRAMLYAILGAVGFVCTPLQHYMFGVSGGKLIERIRSLSFARVVHQEISWFDDPANSSGSIGARLSADASTVQGLVGDTLALIVQNLSTLIAALVISMVANWRLAFILLLMVPLVGLQGYAQMKYLHGFSAVPKVMYEEASQVANDAVSSMRTVVLILYCTYAYFVHEGKATFPEVLKVFMALTMAAIGISQTSAIGPDASNAKDSAASIFSIIDRKSRIDFNIDEGRTLDNVKGEIEFQHISFKYPAHSDVQILKTYV